MSNEKQFQDFKKEVEKLREIDGAEEYANQLAHLFLSNGLSLQTILLMAIEFGQQHPAWVSVEKELPRERGHYLAYTEYGQVWLTEYMQDKGGYWDWFVAPICVGAVSKVTHWMPLPQPPAKKGGEQ